MQICCDGGANHLFDGHSKRERAIFVPDVIIGDLDSIRPEVCTFDAAFRVILSACMYLLFYCPLLQVSAYYTAAGTSLVRVGEQDSHDFDKALAYLESLNAENKVVCLYIVKETF